MDKYYKLDELIIGSGGIKGIYMVGCLYNLNEIHPLSFFKYYTGCSAGSIICLLINLGYTIAEIENIININLKDYQDLKISNLINTYGFDDGTKVKNLFIDFITSKGHNENITFKELYKKTKKILTFATTNLTTGNIEYHNYKSMPNMPVVLSLCMSINVPLLYAPIKFNNNFYVDGAILDAYPFHYHKNTRKIGVLPLNKNDYDFLRNRNSTYFNDGDDSAKYLKSLFIVVYMNYMRMNFKNIKSDTVIILTENDDIDFYDFDLDPGKKDLMLTHGKMSFNMYFKKIYIKRRKRYLAKKYYYIWKNKIAKK